jgi:hypothetical protein
VGRSLIRVIRQLRTVHFSITIRYGGAIYNINIITITNCKIINNFAATGGAVFSWGILNINGSEIIRNTSAEEIINSNGTCNMHFNWINDNFAVFKVIYNMAGPMDVSNNWWGSNEDPSGNLYGVATITPWLILNTTSNPDTINNGANSIITAELLYDSNGIYHDPSNGHVPDGIPVNFTTTLGSIDSLLFMVNGSAQSNLNNNMSAGIANITSTVDNQTIQTQVIILPTASANPVGGLYNKNQNVTLNISVPGTIYYTLDGNDPTTSSSIYVIPININTSTVLKYFAVDSAGYQSQIYTENYTIDTIQPTVSANPTAGLYNSTKDVVLNMSEQGTIYYTLDGSDPTNSSPVYINPITINFDTQLNFFGIDSAGNPSLHYYYTYKIDTIPPTAYASSSGGIYNTTQNVTLNMDKDGIIFYTLDGSDPTNSSSIYVNPITINRNTDLKYIAVDLTGNKSPVYTDSYTIDIVPPTADANPSGGLYNTTQNVILNMTKTGTIYYTLDGSDPISSGFKYVNPITINTNTDLKYFAVDLAGNKSPVYTDSYTIDTVTPTAEANPSGGLYNTTQIIDLNMSKSGKIYYTLDRSTPTVTSILYINSITINSNTTLKYFAVDLAGNKSPEYTENYTIDRIPPTISTIDPIDNTLTNVVNKKIIINFVKPIKPGSAYNGISVTGPNGKIIINTDIDGNILYLTPNSNYLDGNYTFTIPVNAVTDLADNGLETLVTSNFTIDTILPTINSNPVGGLFKNAQNVTITMSKNGTIYYTTNDTNPTINSSKYLNKIPITSSTTLKYIAQDVAGNISPVNSQTYIIDQIPPTIISTDPIRNALNVPTNKVIKITFSETIKAGTMWIELKSSTGKLTPINTSISGTTLTINHSILFNTGKYSLSLHTGCITDMAGNPITLSVYTFTVDSIPPKIKNITPLSKVNVPINQTIKIAFNESIKFGKNSWIEFKNSNGKAIPFTTKITGTTLNITPKSLLAHKTQYIIILHTNSITDLAGNGITAFSTKFTTIITTKSISAFGMSFNYPVTWGTQAYTQDGTSLIYIFDLGNPSIYAPYFQVNINPNTYGTDQETLNAIKNGLFTSGIKVISKKSLTINGNNAYEFIYTTNDHVVYPGTTEDEEIDIVKNHKIYTIDCFAPPNNFGAEKSTFDIMIDSLKI